MFPCLTEPANGMSLLAWRLLKIKPAQTHSQLFPHLANQIFPTTDCPKTLSQFTELYPFLPKTAVQTLLLARETSKLLGQLISPAKAHKLGSSCTLTPPPRPPPFPMWSQPSSAVTTLKTKSINALQSGRLFFFQPCFLPPSALLSSDHHLSSLFSSVSGD